MTARANTYRGRKFPASFHLYHIFSVLVSKIKIQIVMITDTNLECSGKKK